MKEMVKSVNMQLRSKDTDIQRLNIKILRVEKAKEIVDDVLKENLKNAIESQSVINSIASPMSKPKKVFFIDTRPPGGVKKSPSLT